MECIDEMRIALLSDIHGNMPGLQCVLNDLQDFTPDLLVVAGDLSGGPHTNQVIQLLHERKAWMIRGNSDISLIRFADRQTPESWQSRKQFGLLRWNARHISSEILNCLRSLPDQGIVLLPGTDPIRVVHGTPGNPFESIYPNRDPALLERALSLVAEPVLACGHTHEPWIRYMPGKIAVNPGAVAGPLNGETGAQYARLVWIPGKWQVELRTVPYDLASLKEAFRNTGLLDEGGAIARGWLRSLETGADYTLAFLQYAHRLAEEVNCPPGESLPDEIWERASQTFDWNQDLRGAIA